MTTRSVSCRITSYRTLIIIVRTVLLLGALLLGGATDALAQTGTISGTVTGSDTLQGLPNTDIWIFDLEGNGDTATAIVTTNGSGFYTASLPPGTYAVYTQNRLGYINEAHNNRPCSAVCDLEIVDEIVVTNGSSFSANFVLDPGGRVAGRVTDSLTGAGIAGVRLMFIPENAGFFFSMATTDANGDYVSEGGTVTGIVYVMTMNTLGYQNEVWNGAKCGGEACDVIALGTPINVTVSGTTSGIDFALDRGGVITGIVRDANMVPLANVSIRVYDTNGERVEDASTDASGHYTTGGLVSGTYYVGTENSLGLVDLIWVGIPCPNGGFCDPLDGAPVAVTLGEETPDIDFVLHPGGRIIGTVTNAATGLPIGSNAFVGVNDASGQFLGGANTSAGSGSYTIRGLPPGTYYAAVFGPPGFFNQIYNGITCSTNCNVQAGTPIHVTSGADTIGIDFALQPTTAVGTISGTVRDITGGLPGTVVNNLNVQLLTITGAQIANVNTNASGVYTFSNLPVASYYVRTNPGGGIPLIGMLHAVPNDVVCLNCTVTTSGGTPVPVTAGGTTTIDFNLTAGVRISGAVTNAVGGAAIQGVVVQVFSASGANLGQVTTNASGLFTSRALPDGTYFLRTSNTLGFVDKLYDNLFCSGPGCSVFNGTPIAAAGAGTTVTGRNFVLASGGRISGSVVGPNPAQSLQFTTNVQVYTDTGVFLGNQGVDATNNYLTFAVPAGRYYLRTGNSIGLIDELYDNLPCQVLCSVTSGTPVDVTVGVTTSGKNFSLAAGGNIAGTVRNASTNALLSGIRVHALLPDGTLARAAATNVNGEYSMIGLAPGTYYVKTSVAGAGLFFLDELYNEVPCPLTCTLASGEAVVVTAGVTQGGKNFTLTPGGGAVSGTVRDTAGNLLGAVPVQIHLADGTLVKLAASGGNGVFSAILPAGTYYARTLVASAGAYLDELYNELPCTPTCNVTLGAQITVVDSATQGGIDFTLAVNLVKNGRFESATSSWTQFATPDQTYIVSQVTNGVFEYYRVAPPPGTANQAVIFQETGVALPANAPLVARFSIGNSSTVRKRISVLILDSNFGDLSVCTFWLPANAPIARYRMITHTTRAWTNAAIYFYAASPGSNGGFYQLDDVSIEHLPAGLPETTCVDPLAPGPTPNPDSAEWMVNGNFDSGQLAPWGVVGAATDITWQINSGVLEFIRPPGAVPGAVVLQLTGQPAATNDILTATFQLGNSSGVRKRVTVLLHDSNFSDLSACTFWLPPGQPLSTYTYRTYATRPWANATLSVYPATTGADQWIRLDNVSFRRTPNASIVGTECLEPGSGLAPAAGPAAGASPAAGAAMIAARTPAAPDEQRSGPQILQGATALDLTASTSAMLMFESWLTTNGAWGEVQVRGEDGEWKTVQLVHPSDVWRPMAIDLTDYVGQMVDVRFVLYSAAGAAPEIWRIRRSGS